MANTQVPLGAPVSSYETYGNGYIQATAVVPGTVFGSQQCWIASPDSKWVLIMQKDGNFVLYYVVNTPKPLAQNVIFTGDPKFESKTYTKDGAICTVTSDGYVRVTLGETDLWHVGSGNTPAGLYLQVDGNLVLYELAEQPSWNTGPNTGP